MRLDCLLLVGILLATGCPPSGTPDGGAGGESPDIEDNTGADCEHLPEACACHSNDECDHATPLCDPVSRSCVFCVPPQLGCRSGQVCHQGDGGMRCDSTCAVDADCKILGNGPRCCNGRCVNPTNDPTNCGTCGTVCPPVLHCGPMCTNGLCVMIGPCSAGKEDCDRNCNNGCEVDIASDTSNCGACGLVCKQIINGRPVCENGKCSPMCAPGYADCDGDSSNGCEVSTLVDPRNCGACGKACGPGLECAGGNCR